MTKLSDFNDEELALIMDTTRSVLEGAILADGSTSPMRFMKELTAGAKVFREAQRHENSFVKSVAAAIRNRDASASSDRGLPDADEAMSKALKQTEDAITLLRERAAPEDTEAYGKWLIRIATQVAEAAKSKAGGFFSRKVAISDGERAFIEKLTAVLERS